jgi:hypothetical protein
MVQAALLLLMLESVATDRLKRSTQNLSAINNDTC